MTHIPAEIGALTLFVEDLRAAKAFDQGVFGIPVHYEDAASVVFKFGATLVNLLDVRRPRSSSRPPRLRAWRRAFASS